MSRIRIGECYMAKLSHSTQAVRIGKRNSDGSWQVRCPASGRPARVKQASDLLRPCSDEDLAASQTTPNRRSRADATQNTQDSHDLVSEQTSIDENGSETLESVVETIPKTLDDIIVFDPNPKPVKMSLLDAAFAALVEVGHELNTREIVEIILSKGWWTTHGRSPAATLYAALSRDIASHGALSRFCKTARGKFFITNQPR